MNRKEFGKLEEKNETQACRGEKLNATWSCLSELQKAIGVSESGIQLGSKIGGLVESLQEEFGPPYSLPRPPASVTAYLRRTLQCCSLERLI